MGHLEAAELLGPLALDALDPDERSLANAHVQACGACRAELADYREVASLLTTGWVAAPERLWDRIASSIEEVPPPLDLAPVIAMRPPLAPAPVPAEPVQRWGGYRAAMAATMVAATLIVGLMGLKMVDDGRRIGQMAVGLHGTELERAANAALADPQARRVSLRSDDGSLFADAVLLSDGTGYLVKDNLPTLEDDRSYQLWAVVGADTISVGVLGPAPDGVAFRAAGPVAALAITEERAGGVKATQTTPLVVGLI